MRKVITDRGTIRRLILCLEGYTKDKLDDLLGGYIAEKIVQNGNKYLIVAYTNKRYVTVRASMTNEGFNWVVDEWLDKTPEQIITEFDAQFSIV